MKDDKRAAAGQTPSTGQGSLPNRILGSLRDALNAASKDDRSGEISLAAGRADPASAQVAAKPAAEAPKSGPVPTPVPAPARVPESPVAAARPAATADAGREAKALPREPKQLEVSDPTTHALRGSARSAAPSPADTARTQALRGKPKVQRNVFHSDPVVGWLVVVGGPGLGAFRAIYEGNNAIGRGKDQRIPIDFGDPSISSEAQAYIRYDSMDRSFLFVPNLSKTNIVAINDKKPTGAAKLEPMDVITMGRTQLAFVPFCGEEFDWSELPDLKE
jgi:hypothetical protein